MKIFKKLFLNIIFLLAFTHQQVEQVHVENDSLLKKQKSEEMVEDEGEKLQGGRIGRSKKREIMRCLLLVRGRSISAGCFTL